MTESMRNWVVDKNTEVDQLKAELEAARAELREARRLALGHKSFWQRYMDARDAALSNHTPTKEQSK
jgi:hypothetical protein